MEKKKIDSMYRQLENRVIRIKKNFDFVVDCIDSVNSKIHLIKTAKEAGVKIISALGTGNKICPEMLEISDIKNTSYCPLARKVRTLLKKEGIFDLPCVYSKEEAKNRLEEFGENKLVEKEKVSLIKRLLMK